MVVYYLVSDMACIQTKENPCYFCSYFNKKSSLQFMDEVATLGRPRLIKRV
eukprot:CAMPEP_0118698762 /NCGR_PEP_ID=MMETSP0800-20121206/15421_1 /TAXON_ID=210618 ORGANISM="Striatella unipunctata, Strain CCMP2910" /NCGR_SAMPLE_ID=MMETSP0800 /ASSEMBLY_ACC=CAM_ASM_000638 /LENGTH=50 /DNA_ID=CAMNT_0006598699 /DNA_START=72 /DNA_END=224 /DNA_ORIENTATION=-